MLAMPVWNNGEKLPPDAARHLRVEVLTPGAHHDEIAQGSRKNKRVNWRLSIRTIMQRDGPRN
jgi:hypothetical protein